MLRAATYLQEKATFSGAVISNAASDYIISRSSTNLG
jgi:hypothetical protein